MLKVTTIDKNEEIITKIISDKLQFIATRFIASALSNFVNNLSERIHKIKYKYRHDDKKCCGNLWKRKM